MRPDATGARDAVASLSEVIVDMSGSTGPNLTFAIDFGDGFVATTATARHVYAAAGTYTISGSVTSDGGLTGKLTRQISVRDATGSWFHAGYIAKARRVEVRQLTIEAQTGATVRGSYRVTGEPDWGFTGTLIPPRDLRIVADRGVVLEGTLPGRLNDDTATWTLIAHGDSADGQRLEFRAITGTPDAAPPVADMKLRIGRENPWEYVYGYTPGPIPGITPVQIDGTASRGADLSYFLEFGDGGTATTSQATRVVDVDDQNIHWVTARVTVVDRFGRSDARSLAYMLFIMPSGAGDGYWTSSVPDGQLAMSFSGRRGATYAGARFVRNSYSAGASSSYGSDGFSASAILSGDGDIRVTIADMGIEFRGKVTLGPAWDDVWLTVVEYGGKDDGRTWRMRLYWT